MTSGGNRWRVKEMVCIPTCYTEEPIEVRALNVTMPKDEANNGTFSRLVWSEPVVQSPGN
jgi:hypothetical protein